MKKIIILYMVVAVALFSACKVEDLASADSAASTSPILSEEMSDFSEGSQGNLAKDFAWEINDGVLTITGNGEMPNFTAPKDAPWYSYKNDIKSVVVSDGITHLSAYSFAECDSLAHVSLPPSLISTGDYSFYGCDSLEDVSFSEGICFIGEYAFAFCLKLSEVTLPRGITEIETHAFFACENLVNINIPESVKKIGDHTFYFCSSMETLTFHGSVSLFNSIEKGTYWNSNDLSLTVLCTDGEIKFE